MLNDNTPRIHDYVLPYVSETSRWLIHSISLIHNIGTTSYYIRTYMVSCSIL